MHFYCINSTRSFVLFLDCSFVCIIQSFEVGPISQKYFLVIYCLRVTEKSPIWFMISGLFFPYFHS